MDNFLALKMKRKVKMTGVHFKAVTVKQSSKEKVHPRSRFSVNL